MKDKYNLLNIIQRTYDNIPCNSEPERAAVTVRIFDVENEVNLSEIGAYRKADIVSLVYEAVKEKEELMLAKTDNLESIVIMPSPEPTKSAIVYEVIKSYAKDVSKIPRYALFGALPAKIQRKLGKKYGENPLNYTGANIVAESIANAGLIAYLAPLIKFGEPNPASVTVLFFSLYSGLNMLFRFLIRSENKANGNLLIRGLYESIGYTLSAFKNRYIAKKEELTAKLEQKNLPQIENIEAKQLLSPVRKAIINTAQIEDLLDRKLKK